MLPYGNTLPLVDSETSTTSLANPFDLLAAAISKKWPRPTSRAIDVPVREQGAGNPSKGGRVSEPNSDAADPYGELFSAMVRRWPDLRLSALCRTVVGIGSAVENRRRQLGLSQTQVADMASVGRRFISDFENGKPSVQMGEALRVLDALGLRVSLRPTASTKPG